MSSIDKSGTIRDFGEMPPERKLVAQLRDYGSSANGPGTFTMHMCRRMPAEFDAIQIVLHGAASGANTFKAAIAPSAQFNNGWQPKDAANADQTFTAVTFGTTDRQNPRNPGGGAATATVTGTSGSNASGDLIEGDIASDIISLRSLDRTDIVGAPPLLMVRVYGVSLPASNASESSAVNANPWSSVIPDFYSGYWATDAIATPPGAAPSQDWLPNITINCFLRGKRVYNMAVAGDSVEQGWIAATAVPQFGGNINGWGRRFAKLCNDIGVPVSYISLAHTGQKSRVFHERAINYLLTGSLTHLFVKVWSTNESADGMASAYAAVDRCNKIIQMCLDRGVIPILVPPWGGQGDGTAMKTYVLDYIEKCKQSGILVFDPRSITDASNGTLRQDFKTVNSGGAVVDGTHLNSFGQDEVAMFAFRMRREFMFA